MIRLNDIKPRRYYDPLISAFKGLDTEVNPGCEMIARDLGYEGETLICQNCGQSDNFDVDMVRTSVAISFDYKNNIVLEIINSEYGGIGDYIDLFELTDNDEDFESILECLYDHHDGPKCPNCGETMGIGCHNEYELKSRSEVYAECMKCIMDQQNSPPCAQCFNNYHRVRYRLTIDRIIKDLKNINEEYLEDINV
ncbi:MAG: hypothetical protein WCY30_07220 [Candidatus Neomarinimicrobiota bacterium]|jgi:hypothetical protein